MGTYLRRCWNCGRAIGARDKFCGQCGARQRSPKRTGCGPARPRASG